MGTVRDTENENKEIQEQRKKLQTFRTGNSILSAETLEWLQEGVQVR